MVEFSEPLLVMLTIHTSDDPCQLIKEWKAAYLNGPVESAWKKLGTGARPSSAKIFKLFVVGLWPVILLAMAAYFSSLSAVFLAIMLLPIQLLIAVFGALKLLWLAEIAAAYTLEEKC